MFSFITRSIISFTEKSSCLRIIIAGTIIIEARLGIEFSAGELEANFDEGIRGIDCVAERIEDDMGSQLALVIDHISDASLMIGKTPKDLLRNSYAEGIELLVGEDLIDGGAVEIAVS